MRKRSTILLLAIAVGLLLATPVPASAEQPVRGHHEIVLSFTGPDDLPVCFPFAWVGTITFEGDPHVYGYAEMPQLPPPDPEKKPKSYHFADLWEIYADELTGLDGCPALEDDVVMWGHDKGVQSDVNLRARSNGTVGWADGVYFDASLVGRTMHWSGVTEDSEYPVLTFEGPFRIN